MSCKYKPKAPKCDDCVCQFHDFDHITHVCRTCQNKWFDDGKEAKW